MAAKASATAPSPISIRPSASTRNSQWPIATASAYFKAGKAALGLPDAEKSLELSPNDPATLDTRGSIFEALGRREEAVADFRRALSKTPICKAARTV